MPRGPEWIRPLYLPPSAHMVSRSKEHLAMPKRENIRRIAASLTVPVVVVARIGLNRAITTDEGVACRVVVLDCSVARGEPRALRYHRLLSILELFA